MSVSTPLLNEDASQEEAICIGPLRVCPRTGLIERNGTVQKLRPKELELIRYLHGNSGRIISRDELLARVWKCRQTMATRTIDQTVSSLRRKVGDDSDSPRYVITIHGLGYRLASAS